jgi:hypothetical protein
MDELIDDYRAELSDAEPATDVTVIPGGRWGLSRALQDADGGWTTYALDQLLAPKVENYWPPQAADGTPLVNAVLVRLVGTVTAPADGNTVLFPRDLEDIADVELGELTVNQRNALRNTLETWLTGYTFVDYDGSTRIVPAFTAENYTAATTLKRVARDVFRHLGHSIKRPRRTLIEIHNTEYLDNFGTDPFSAPRWTTEASTTAWDSGNSELDGNLGSDWAARYSINSPGSIEHETQITAVTSSTFRMPGPATRFANEGTNDYYGAYYESASTLTLARWNAAARTALTNLSLGTFTAGDWYTFRGAAQGANGANVVLSYWILDHNASKPSDPGWIGVDGSPDGTFTDTAAGRLDDDTIHLQCGSATRSTTDYDPRLSFFKQRAITDRGGAVVVNVLELSVQFNRRHTGRFM